MSTAYRRVLSTGCSPAARRGARKQKPVRCPCCRRGARSGPPSGGIGTEACSASGQVIGDGPPPSRRAASGGRPARTWAGRRDRGRLTCAYIILLNPIILGGAKDVTGAALSIPLALKHAIAVGIGAFLALVGFIDSGFVTSSAASPPLTLGTGGHLATWPALVFAVTLLLMIVLDARRVPGAILISIIAGTVAAVAVQENTSIKKGGWGVVTPDMPDKLFAAPDFGLFGEIDLFGGFAEAGVITALVVLFTLVLSGFFDAMGTILGISDEAGLVSPKGEVPRLGRILSVDGLSAAFGGITSSSANTVFVEPAAGVGEGARTGLANIATGALFAVTLFLTPLAATVPAQAAAPALVVVGALMMAQVAKVASDDLDIAIPAFLTIVLMPFAYSITIGNGGMVSYVLIKAARGRWREVSVWLWPVVLLFLIFFAIEPIEQWLDVR